MQKDAGIILITLLISGGLFFWDRKKALAGIRKGAKMLEKTLPQFLLLLALVSIFLGLVPPDTLMSLLGRESESIGVASAAIIGSIAIIPGPIAYPLAGLLRQNGVSYMVLATFITTLMMVGVLTFPVEKEYLGVRIALTRNLLCFLGAILVSILVGVLL